MDESMTDFENNLKITDETASIKRVAVYCSVSTDDIQKEWYTKLFSQHEDWKLVGIYIDRSISSTRNMYGERFRKMIMDCREGKIDLVITKSISKFTRSADDCWMIIYYFNSLANPVEVYFVKERLSSFDHKFAELLKIVVALAHDGSSFVCGEIRRTAYLLKRDREEKEFISMLFGSKTDNDVNTGEVKNEEK